MDQRQYFSLDDIHINNKKIAPNTLTIEHDSLTISIVILDKLMDCDL